MMLTKQTLNLNVDCGCDLSIHCKLSSNPDPFSSNFTSTKKSLNFTGLLVAGVKTV